MPCCNTISSLLLALAIIIAANESNALTVIRRNDQFLQKSTTTMISTSRNCDDNNPISLRDKEEPAFPNCLPKERLGTRHDTLESFYQAIGTATRPAVRSKEYTLIVVTETLKQQQRILLGMKNRGFGTGKYNSFGGKFLHDENDHGERETVEECACRELEEETNLEIPIKEMIDSKVGVQRFTFEDSDKEMIVHLFFLDLAKNKHGDGSFASYDIPACDEITPKWFESFDLVPFDNMFADDSLWLTALLSAARIKPLDPSSSTPSRTIPPLEINGSYHFKENCEETNTIFHYHMDIQSPNRE